VSLSPKWKLWLEHEGEYVFGAGAYTILKSIHESGTIAEGAKRLGRSYRHIWGVIRKIERQTGRKLLETFKGGSDGGGGAHLTDYALELMEVYARVTSEFNEIVESITKEHL
jgi:molybdate transport system regulatory protein